jgi:excisionase family DNA binding protein
MLRSDVPDGTGKKPEGMVAAGSRCLDASAARVGHLQLRHTPGRPGSPDLVFHFFCFFRFDARLNSRRRDAMPRTHDPNIKAAANAAAAARYAPISYDPINPLAAEVGRAVAAEVEGLTGGADRKASKGAAASSRAGEELVVRLTNVIVRTLGRSLSEPTAAGRALRMALIAKLANAEIGGAEVNSGVSRAPASPEDSLLTTAEAASKLEVSRPYVSMLCDAGKLGEVVMTEGGHRRIRASAVESYLAARIRQSEGVPSAREAGVDAGLYDHPDGYFQNKIREAEAGKSAKPRATRAARKTRP